MKPAYIDTSLIPSILLETENKSQLPIPGITSDTWIKPHVYSHHLALRKD